MKFFIFIFLVCITCNSKNLDKTTIQKKSINKIQDPMQNIPTVNADFEKIFLDKIIQNHLDKLSSKGLPFIKSKVANSYEYELILDDRQIVRYYYEDLVNSDKSYATENIFYKKSPFLVSKIFYKNGNVKEKGVKIANGNVYKAIWYYYDLNGKLTNTIDNDKIFKFVWGEVEKFMTEYNIEISLGKDKLGRNSINRFSNLLFPLSSEKDKTQLASQPLWLITYRGNSFNQYWDIVLDGNDGKMLSRKKYWISEAGESVPEEVIENF